MEGSLFFDLLPQVKTETRSQKYLQCKFHLSSLLRSGLTGMFFLLGSCGVSAQGAILDTAAQGVSLALGWSVL